MAWQLKLAIVFVAAALVAVLATSVNAKGLSSVAGRLGQAATRVERQVVRQELHAISRLEREVDKRLLRPGITSAEAARVLAIRVKFPIQPIKAFNYSLPPSRLVKTYLAIERNKIKYRLPIPNEPKTRGELQALMNRLRTNIEGVAERDQLLMGFDSDSIISAISNVSIPNSKRLVSYLMGMEKGAKSGFHEFKLLVDSAALSKVERQIYYSSYAAIRRNYMTNIFGKAIDELVAHPSVADIFSRLESARTLSRQNAGVGRNDIPDRGGTSLSGNDQNTFESMNGAQSESKTGLADLDSQYFSGDVSGSDYGDKVAILIAEQEYQDQRIPQLETPIKDIEDVGNILESKFGYEVVKLINPSQMMIAAALWAVAESKNSRDENSDLIIYYAGHGYFSNVNKQGFWIPSDGKVDGAEKWISTHDLSRMIAKINFRHVAVISDSCYSGLFVGAEQRFSDYDFFSEEDMRQIRKWRSAVVMSSGGDEPVMDEGLDGHSIFAYAFIKGINNIEDGLYGHNLFESVKKIVANEAPQTPRYGAMTAANHQSGSDYLFAVSKTSKNSVGARQADNGAGMYKLTSISHVENVWTATINGVELRDGDQFGNIIVMAIQSNKVVLKKAGGSRNEEFSLTFSGSENR